MSLIVTASFPKPEIVPAVFAAYISVTEEIVPVSVVTSDAFTATVVRPSRVSRSATATVVSVITKV